LTRIFAPIFAWNEASQAVARNSGFVREGSMPRSAIKDGRVIDRVVWAAYRPDAPPRPADIDAALAAAGAPPTMGGTTSAQMTPSLPTLARSLPTPSKNTAR
jgi:hypothetical protein